MPTTITADALRKLDPTQLNPWYRPAPGAGVEIVLADGSHATVIGARSASWLRPQLGALWPVDISVAVATVPANWFEALPGTTSHDIRTRPAVPVYRGLTECHLTVDGETPLPVVVRHRAHPVTSGAFCTAYLNEPYEIENPGNPTFQRPLVTCPACLVTYRPGWDEPARLGEHTPAQLAALAAS